MFVSIRDQGRRRRSHTYGVNKAARSSKLSLLSAITTGSHGSNDSASTITQESYARSSSGSAGKRRRSSQHKRPREGRERKVSSAKGVPSEKSKEEKTMSRESVNVFAFLVDENAQDASSSSAGFTEQPTQPTLENATVLEESDGESAIRSQHSDSGISMGDNSSVCHPNGDPPQDGRLPPLPEDSHEPTDMHSRLRDRPPYPRRPRWKWPDVPPATHKHLPPRVTTRTPSPEQFHVRTPHTPHTPSHSEKDFGLLKMTPSGYDLVAGKLAQAEMPPLFRKFKKTNFRVLLQLQDEIIEMEQELAALDFEDTRTRLQADGSTSPASRRINWQWSYSDLHAHRVQVLGRLYVKIEQYYQAVLSAQKMQRLSSPAMPEEVERFRAWLQTNNPLSAPESKFLDDEEDLIELKGGTSTTVPTSASEDGLDCIPLCVLVMMLFPVLCFKFMTGVLNRMILLTALLAAGLSSLEKLDRSMTNLEQRPLRLRLHQQCVVACFGISFLAAVFF